MARIRVAIVEAAMPLTTGGGTKVDVGVQG